MTQSCRPIKGHIIYCSFKANTNAREECRLMKDRYVFKETTWLWLFPFFALISGSRVCGWIIFFWLTTIQENVVSGREMFSESSTTALDYLSDVFTHREIHSSSVFINRGLTPHIITMPFGKHHHYSVPRFSESLPTITELQLFKSMLLPHWSRNWGSMLICYKYAHWIFRTSRGDETKSRRWHFSSLKKLGFGFKQAWWQKLKFLF